MDEQRLQEIEMRLRKQTPCAHENHDVRLGDGTTWAKCEDCQATFKRSSLSRVAKSAREYEDAIDALIAEVRRLRQDNATLTEIRQKGCDCADDDACRYARERDAAFAEVSALTRERDAAREANMTTTLVLAVARQDALDAQAERDSANTNWEAEHAECDRQFIARRKAEAERDAALAERDALKKEARRIKHEYAREMDFTNAYIKRCHALTAALTEARRVLREVEWLKPDVFIYERCPACDGEKPRHRHNCALAAVLAQEETR